MRKSLKGRTRVLIVDPLPIMRLGLAQVINAEPDLLVAGEAGTAEQALNLISARQADLVLTDLSLPDKSGLELVKDLRMFHPRLPVLVTSTQDENLLAERVLRAGGRGYVMKQAGAPTLLLAIRRVLSGQISVSDRVSSKLLEGFSGRGKGSPLEELSDREFQVFQMLGKGAVTRDIAEQLRVSPKTVDVHRGNIKRRLRLRTGRELVRFAIRWAEAQNSC